jgi:ATP-dependent protease ClpP protease subunit
MTLLDDARTAWEGSAMLALAWPDFQTFARAYCGMRGEGLSDALQLQCEQMEDWDASATARTRLRAAHARLRACEGSPARGPFPVATVDAHRNTLWVYGSLSQSVDSLGDALTRLPSTSPVLVRIDSSGGAASPALELSRRIVARAGHSTALIDRACWSAAVPIAVACDRVLIRENATLMLHPCRGAFAGTAAEMIERAQQMRLFDAEVLRFIAQRRRRAPLSVLRALSSSPVDVFHSAKQCLALGLVDAVVPSLAIHRQRRTAT